VVHVTHPQTRKDLDYWNVTRHGEYFTFYTPYHLVTNEIPLSIVWAVEDGEPTVAPSKGLVSEVVGSAKSDLKSETLLDGGGGYCVFGVIDLATRAKAENAVPFGLLNGAKLLRDVKRDQALPMTQSNCVRIPCSTP
jgi:predicted homoserine dehydrogenase-like protein